MKYVSQVFWQAVGAHQALMANLESARQDIKAAEEQSDTLRRDMQSTASQHQLMQIDLEVCVARAIWMYVCVRANEASIPFTCSALLLLQTNLDQRQTAEAYASSSSLL